METAAHSGGNIIQGFDGYLKNAPGGRRKYEVGDTDRLFSMSSMTHKKVSYPPTNLPTGTNDRVAPLSR